MCDKAKSNNIRKINEIVEPYPATKLQWITNPTHDDFLATSSDILRLYKLKDDFRQLIPIHAFVNNSEFCGPLTSFDWNRYD